MFLTFFWFCLGIGSIGLGAFFLCRMGLGLYLPIGMVLILSLLVKQTEIALGVVWGSVAVNLALIGFMSFFYSECLVRENFWQILWMFFSLVAMLVLVRNTQVGIFGGCGLLLVGFVAFGMQRKHIMKYSSVKRKSRGWAKIFLYGLILCVGIVVLLWRYHLIATFCGMPGGRWLIVLVMPVVSIFALWGQLKKSLCTKQQTLQGLLWCNVFLLTFGCGLMAVVGQLQFSQLTSVVVLPWLTLMTIMAGVMFVMPKKITRWWGGLLVIMYVGLLFSLLF